MAWAAGLFEGEGSITVSHSREYAQPRLKLSMVDADVVERFARIVGCGHLADQRFRNVRFKTQRCWYVGNRRDVVYVLEMFMPWLGERRRARSERVMALALRTPFEGWDADRSEDQLEADHA